MMDEMEKPWLVEFRSQLHAGEMVEFKAEGRWQRRRIKSVNGNAVAVQGYQLERNMIWPAHGESELT